MDLFQAGRMVQVEGIHRSEAFFNHGDFTASYAAGSDVVQVVSTT